MSRPMVTTPAEGVVEGFVAHLRDVRALSQRSIEVYASGARRFLAHLGDRDLRGLSAADVAGALLSDVDAGRAPATVRRYGCGVRSFLRYCLAAGLIDRDLSTAALPVSGRRRSLLPSGVKPEEATALLDACDRDRAQGDRDRAVIVLMLRLGLRASEVAALRLDDINWRAGQLIVHGKRGRVVELPLPVEVGIAIATYLRDGRPVDTNAREVFLRATPPPVGLSRGGVTGIVASASQRAGIGVVRAHRLRHTAATDMLRHGAALAEIGEVLGHRSTETTAIYARVDVARLRTIARPWPKEIQW